MVVVNGTELGNGWNKTSCTDGTYGTYCKYTQSCPIQVNGTSLSCVEVNGVSVFDNRVGTGIQLMYDYRNLPGTCIGYYYNDSDDEWEYYVEGSCCDFRNFNPQCVCLACINDLNLFNIPKCTVAYWTDRRITPATFRTYNGCERYGTDCLSFIGVSSNCPGVIDSCLSKYGVAVVFYGGSYEMDNWIYCGTNVCGTGCPYAFRIIYRPECFKDYYFSCYGHQSSSASQMYGKSSICMDVLSDVSYWSCNKLTNFQSCGNQTCRCICEEVQVGFGGVPDQSLTLTFGYQVNKNLRIAVCPKGGLKLHGEPTCTLCPYRYQSIIDPEIYLTCRDCDFGLGGWKTTCTIQNSSNGFYADICVNVPYCCQSPVCKSCWVGFYPVTQQPATTPSGRYSWYDYVCTDFFGFTARDELGCMRTVMLAVDSCPFTWYLGNDCDIEIMPEQNWYVSAVSSDNSINTNAYVSCVVGNNYNCYADACAGQQALARPVFPSSGFRYGNR